MKKDNHSSSRLLIMAGGMMTLSAILMALCSRLTIGGMFLATAFCMFVSAHHFRATENRQETIDEFKNEQK